MTPAMSRIVYLGFPTGDVAGGQKMILRHVETLRDLGFDAVFWRRPDNVMPAWAAYSGPVEAGTPFRSDDLLVIPSDAPNALRQAAGFPQPVVVFCQNQFSFATSGVEAFDAFPPDRRPILIAPGRVCAASLKRLYPAAQVEVVPCFADERMFRPDGERRPAVAFAPRKRPAEPRGIRNFLVRMHPRHADLPWTRIENLPEAEVAAVMAASSLFLSLARWEAVGMTGLEAMACGCLVAGFTGIGGADYATAENGFWAAEDDMQSAADALAEAADVSAAGGGRLEAVREAGFATAREWSYANFRLALEEVWMRLAPEARVRNGPLG